MDIKKPDLSVVLEKLSFLRNNLALLVPIVLVVVAGLLFIPTTLFSKSLQKKMDSGSVDQGKACDKLLTNGVVPKEQYMVARQNLEGYAQDANEMIRLNQQCVQRSLLNYRILPEPKDGASQKYEDFGKAFCGGIIAMIQEAKGTVPPSADELGMDSSMMMGGAGGGAYGGNDAYGGAMMMGPGGRGGRGGARQPGDLQQEFAKQEKYKQDVICLDKAMSGAFYVTPLDIVGYEHWAAYEYTSRDEAIESCWYWQHGYWIIEDVFDTVAQCNQGSNSVLSSPVKRLVDLKYIQDFQSETGGAGGMYDMYGGGGGRGGGGAYGSPYGGGMTGGSQKENIPQFVINGEQSLATPVSARYSNEEYRIIHFNMSVVLEASYQVEFMKILCSAKTHVFKGYDGDQPNQPFKHNQITILASHTKPVVQESMTNQFYRYGDNAVVELNLTCEYLLPFEGYAVWEPEILKPSEE
jgi:hypothetical protein